MTSPPGLLIGDVRPRVELTPPAAYTLGPEAGELARRAGLPPETWQGDALDVLLSVRPDGLWACYEYGELVGRQQGKTSGIGIPRVLAGLFLLGERLILWSAHEYKTALEAFLRVKEALLTLGEEINPTTIVVDGITIRVNNTNGEEGFTLSTGQRLRFVARSKGSGRGFSGDLVVIDEAFAYTRMQQSALEPTLSARPNPQVLYLSSPPLDGESGDVLYALRDRAKRGDVELGWRDWGLEMDLDQLARLSRDKREKYLDDRRNWAAALPALGQGRSTEEAVERLRRSLDEFDFAREVLGLWPKRIDLLRGWTVIAEEPWRARGGLESERPTESVMFGLDASWPAAEMGAITVAGRLGEEVTVQVVEHRAGTGWMVRRAIELDKTHPDAVFVLDPKGPAGHLLPELEEAGLEVIQPDAGDIARAFGRFLAEVLGDEPSLRHYDQKELNDAVRSAVKRKLGDGFAWARQGDADICTLTAATVALIGVFEGSLTPWAVYA